MSKVVPLLLLAAALAATSLCVRAQEPSANPVAGSLAAQIAQHEHALSVARKNRTTREEGTELNTLGTLYRQAGDTQKALDYLGQELQLWRRANSQNGEALALDNTARVYADMGQDARALEFYGQALLLWRAVQNRRGEAMTLSNQCRTYSDMGQEQKALELCREAVPIWQETGSHGAGEAGTFGDLAKVYSDLGEKEKALELDNQALTAWRAAGNAGGEALTLSNIGKTYSDLGQRAKALEFHNQALPIWHRMGDRNGEALTLNYIGRVYGEEGQNAKALDAYAAALTLWRASGDRRGEASTLTYTGMTYAAMGEPQRALALYQQALPIWQGVGNRNGEAVALIDIGLAYDAMKQSTNALPSEMAALALARSSDDPDLLGKINAALMRHFRSQNQLEAAILFGTDAVNSFQRVRRKLTGLDKDLQDSFTQARSGAYRLLAELLVQANRLADAEAVLDLLKEQELREVVLDAAGDASAKAATLPLSMVERQAHSELSGTEKTALNLAEVNAEYAALTAKSALSSGERARLKALDAQIEAGNSEVSAFFRTTLYPQLASSAGTAEANALLSSDKTSVSQLQNTLAQLGPRIIGIRLLLGETHVYEIVVTAHTRQKIDLTVTPSDLRGKVLQVRDELRSPVSDPRPHLLELYRMLVAPLESALQPLEDGGVTTKAGEQPASTLLWSLDGALRYVPMAALYDGSKFMVERFNNVLFTPESYGHMSPDTGKTQVRVLAMGLSRSYGGLPALTGVRPELEAVVHDPSVPGSHGPMEGRMLENDQFTLAALQEQLGGGNGYSVVHIASHFILESGNASESYLMLGGDETGDDRGFALTLSRTENSPISFHGTRLLTLSACSTGASDAARDGLEMDSLGMIAQRKDAEAVLASLWDVNDASTSRLMSEFYTRWLKAPVQGKAEALRRTQLGFLHGKPESSDGHGERGIRVVPGAGATAQTRMPGYTHPFYWAPFVLVGNFQ